MKTNINDSYMYNKVNELCIFNSMKSYFFRFNSDLINSIIDKLLTNGDSSTNTSQSENVDTEIMKSG